MWEMRNANNSVLGKPEGKNCLTDLNIDGRIILKWVFKAWDMRLLCGNLILHETGISTYSRLLAAVIM